MKHILIIDDDIHINEMLDKVLKQEGYQVSHAYSGTEALLLLSTCRPDLILLDLMLPSLSGEEVLPQFSGCFLASNFPHFHRYDSLKSALYIHAVSKNINTFPKNQGRIRAAIAVEILDFTVMYR